MLNEQHLAAHPSDTDLAARIAAYELAAKMQLSAAEVTDLSGETASTLALYGADDTENTTKARFAQNCILARRLIEKGVRFVQLFNGAYAMGEGVGNWDGHKTLVDQYAIHGPILDQPVAGLLRDLKDRGLLADTLVAFVTEFGRMPPFQKGASGRDHNPAGFTVWLAGAGVKRAFHYGATDEFGYKAVENVATIYDLHAEFRSGGWWARALYSEARVSDTELLYAADPTKAVGERMRGWYAELGYDLMTALAPESSQQLIPWVRYETVDTQASLAAGLPADDAAETTNVAFGVDWLPIPNIVFKAGYRDYEDGGDRLEASLGYVF
jgi:hypothetical protein